MLAEELIEMHRSPREVAPFSARYPGLTPAAGYQAARALREYRLVQGWKPVGRQIASEIVTTGVLTDAHPLSPGETWSTEIAGLPLPGLRITFA